MITFTLWQNCSPTRCNRCSFSQTTRYLCRNETSLPPLFRRHREWVEGERERENIVGHPRDVSWRRTKGMQCTYPHTIPSPYYSAYSESFFPLSPSYLIFPSFPLTTARGFYPVALFSLSSVVTLLGFAILFSFIYIYIYVLHSFYRKFSSSL